MEAAYAEKINVSNVDDVVGIRSPAISADLLSAVISIRYILSFRKDNPNVFNMSAQNRPVSSGIKCICC